MQTISKNSNIVYCHGVPGSSAEIELSIAVDVPRPHVLKPLDFETFNKLVLDSQLETVHIVGFSLGAMTAIKIAALHPDRVSKLTLIAPAVPLELGDFLPHMAGQLVFNTASKWAPLFSVLTFIQRLGVAFAPNRIIKTMFTGSPKPDLELLSNVLFKESLIGGMRSSFGEHRHSYCAAVREYVRPWAHHLPDINCPVTIYHGSEDNWAPIEMSYALKNTINTETDLIVLDTLGHYSALHKALPLILNEQLR